MRIASFLICLLCASACRKPCPPVEQPRPVPTISKDPDCNLPELPDPIAWPGVTEYDEDGKETGWTLLTQEGLADLGGYLAGIANWTIAAQGCLRATR